MSKGVARDTSGREQQLLEESLHHRPRRAQAADLQWQSVLERSRSLETDRQETHRNESQNCAANSTKPARGAEELPRCGWAGGPRRAGRAVARTNPERSLLHRGRCAESCSRQIRAAMIPRGSALWGVLADLRRGRAAIWRARWEQFLRDELEYVCGGDFRRPSRAAGIALLREEVGGRGHVFSWTRCAN